MKQNYCKYFFTFQDEYWEEFENEIRDILNISVKKNPGKKYRDEDKCLFILSIYESGLGAVVFTSYYYVTVMIKATIFVQEKDAPRVEELLHKYRTLIYEEYGEDHLKEIKLRNNEEILYLEKLATQYDFYQDIKEFLI